MVREAQRNPGNAQAMLAGLNTMLSLGPHPNARNEGLARTGASKVFRVSSVAAPVAPGATVGAITIQWRFTGRVLAMYGQVSTGLTADYASMSTKILVGGEKSIITTGDADTFAPFLALFGPNQNWFPLNLEVKNGDSWSVFYFNQGFSATSMTPDLLFSFLDYGTSQTAVGG